MNISINNTKKIYTAFIAALPLFSVYASGISGFTLGDILLFLFFVYGIILGYKNIKFNLKTIPLVLFVVSVFVLSTMSILIQPQPDIYNICIRITRRFFYYMNVVVMSMMLFDFAYGKKTIIIIGKIGVVFLFLQYLAFYLGNYVLHGYFTFLPLYHENYSLLDYEGLYRNIFRPTSFLLEPAHFSRYLCIPLVLCIFGEQIKNNFVWAVFMSAAIIASTSGTGAINVIVIWLSFIAYKSKKYISSRKMDWKYLGVLVILFFAGVLLLNTTAAQIILERIFSSDLNDVNTAAGARFRGYIQYLQLPFVYQIIGMGYGSTPNTSLGTWFSGASYLLYGCGIIGFLICLVFFLSLFTQKNTMDQKILALVFFLLFFMDDCFMSHVFVVYMSFIYGKSNSGEL